MSSTNTLGPSIPTGLVAVLCAVGLGLMGGPRPELALAGAGVAGLALLSRTFPVLLFAGLMLVAPLQPVLAAIDPGLKVLDEGVVLLFSASVLGVALWRAPRELFRHPLLWWSLGFLGLGGLSGLLNGVGLEQTVMGLFVTLDYVVLAIALLVLPVGRTTLQAVIAVLLVLGALAAALGFVQHVLELDALPSYARFIWERDMLRVPSFLRHPNDLAYLMLPVTFVAAAGLWLRGGVVYALAALVGAAGMLLAVSRSSYVALALGLLCAVLFGGLASRKVWGLLLGAGLLLAPLMAPGIISRIEKVQREGGDARFTYAKQGLEIARDRPLLGVGPGRFGGVVAQRYGSDVHKEFGIEFNSTWMTVDSYWLHLVVESGLLGMLAMLGLLFEAFRRARRRLLRGEGSPEQRILCLALLMLIPAHVLINLSAMALEANTTAAVLWLLVGLALAPNVSGEEPTPALQ
jgi:O-antigen ligase